MKKKHKRFFLPHDMWNVSALEQWLEAKAKQGWMPTAFGGWFGDFEPVEPSAIRFRLEPYRDETIEQREEREAFYEEMGWSFVNTWSDYRLYACMDAAARDLHTDDSVRAMALDRQMRKTRRWIVIDFIVSVVGIGFFLRSVSVLEKPVQYLAHGLSPYLVCLLALVVLELADRFRILRGILRLRREVAAGVPLSGADGWKLSRNVNVVRWCFSIGLLVASLAFPLYQMTASGGLSDSEEPLPIASLRVIDPSLADEEFQWEGGTRNVSMMAAGYYEIWEHADDETWLSARVDCLRLACLAKPLYEEWLAAEDGEITPLEDPRFESAVLLEYENGTQAFLGYQDRIVLYQAVHADGDLRDHINDFAAVMAEFGK